MGLGTWGLGLGTWDLGHLGLGTWDTPRSPCSVLSSELQVPALGGHHNSVILGRD